VGRRGSPVLSGKGQDAEGVRLVFRLQARASPGLRCEPYTVEAPAPPGEQAAAREAARRLSS
jgi:hypothetical protein